MQASVAYFFRVVMVVLCGAVFAVPAVAQVVQRGIVLEMSSGEKPVAGVEIRAAGAAPTDSDAGGLFVLDFPDALSGDPFLLDNIYKKGFEIVNREKVDKWNLSADAMLKIVLGRTEVIDSLRKKYYRIGTSAAEKEYEKSLAELHARKKLYGITDEAYVRMLDSLSMVRVKLRTRIETYARMFSRINHDELDAVERQALALLDKGDMSGAIRLYERMRTDSVLIQRMAGRKVAEDDLAVLLPSLMHDFEIMKQVGDVAGCDSVGRIIFAAAGTVGQKLPVAEWMLVCRDADAALDCYGMLVREAQTLADVEQIQTSLFASLAKIKLSKAMKKKTKLLEERMNARKNWARIKENTWKNE